MGRQTKFRGAATPGVFAQNVEFLTDIISGGMVDGGSTEIKVLVQLTTAVKLQMTIDGTIFGYLNSGVALAAASLYEFPIRVRHGAIINLRTDDGAGTTVTLCEVHEDRR